MWAFKSAFITNIRPHRSHLWVLVPCTNFLCILKSSATKNVLPHSSPKIIQKLVKILFIPKKKFGGKKFELTNMISCSSFVNIGNMFLQAIRVNKRFVAPITLMHFQMLVNSFDVIFYFCFGTKPTTTQMTLVIFSSFMNLKVEKKCSISELIY